MVRHHDTQCTHTAKDLNVFYRAHYVSWCLKVEEVEEDWNDARALGRESKRLYRYMKKVEEKQGTKLDTTK